MGELMHLNDDRNFPLIDRQNMLALIDALPQQFKLGWELGQGISLPGWSPCRIIFAGVGGAAAAAEFLTAFLSPRWDVPCTVHHDYSLPAWATGEDTYVVALSHSGESEETLSAFQQAIETGCRVLAITTGGTLAEKAVRYGKQCVRYTHAGPSRTAVGLVYGLLLGIFSHLDIPFTVDDEVASTLAALLNQQAYLKAEAPLARNPAKRIAGQFLERWVSLFAAEHLTPAARRWKTQINELAKALAFFEIIPEADYNALMGFSNPAGEISHGMIFFLQSSLYNARNQLRMEMTRKALMLEGINSDFYIPPGDTLLAQQCCALHFGDYLAYYLAMLYEINPTPVDMLESLKMDLEA